MSVRQLNYLKLFPTVLLMWWGTVFSLFAASPQVVDIKPYNDGFVMACGEGMIYWTDIEGAHIDSVNIKTGIAGIEVVEGSVLAVSPDCMVIKVERNGKTNRLCRRQINGNTDKVTGIACSGGRTYILTENGIIRCTTDCRSFTLFDFNQTYSGYYDPTHFSAICASDNTIFIAGTYYNGMPAVFTSSAGNIWSERSLTYTDRSETLSLEQQPLSMAYDSRMDRFVLVCTDGYLFYMPGCSHCNSIEHKSLVDITAIGFNNSYCIYR